jgi:hypothetical protein
MSTLIAFLRMEMWFLLGGATALVAYQLLTGQINTNGLWVEKNQNPPRTLSPSRIQLFVLSLGIAFYWLLMVLQHPATGRLPDLPNEMVWVLAGSQAVYLGRKSYSFLFQRDRQSKN